MAYAPRQVVFATSLCHIFPLARLDTAMRDSYTCAGQRGHRHLHAIRAAAANRLRRSCLIPAR